jgi:hypothetical protein
VTRLISIAEEFTIGRFIDATERLVPTTPDFVPTLWEHELANVSSNWARRIGGWKQLHHLNVKRFPYWAELDGYIAARNIIAHGLGTLTSRQWRDDETTPRRLGAAKIEIHARRLALDASHVERCAELVGLYIDWLDVSAPTPTA